MEEKKVLMFKNGEYIPWDGSDVSSLIIHETMTLSEFRKYYPEEANKLGKI